jgi:hypothetical protein
MLKSMGRSPKGPELKGSEKWGHDGELKVVGYKNL